MRESAIDSLLIRYKGVRSANELSEMTGLTPEDVVRRQDEILSGVLMSEDQMFAKMLFQMQEQIAEMGVRVPKAVDEDAARLSNTLAGLAGRVLKAVEDRRKLKDKDSKAAEVAQARQALAIVESSFNRYLGMLKERYPDINEKQIEGEFYDVLIEVAAEHDAL